MLFLYVLYLDQSFEISTSALRIKIRIISDILVFSLNMIHCKGGKRLLWFR